MNADYPFKTKTYFATTFGTTFAFWLAGAWLSQQPGNNGAHMVLMLVGLVAPFLISLMMIRRSGDTALIADYRKRLFQPRLMRPRMVPAMLLLMPFSVLIAIALSLGFGQSVEQFRLAEGFSFSAGFVPVLLLLLLAAAFEELGWRGYAFDSLQRRFGNLGASWIFGLLWSAWHLPLIFVAGSYQYEIYQQSPWFAVNFFASIVPMGVIVSWVCLKNRKSILAAVVFHFVVNLSQEALAMTQPTKCIQTFVLLAAAVGIVLWDKKTFPRNAPRPAASQGWPCQPVEHTGYPRL